MLLKAFSSQWKLPLKTIPLDWGDTSNSVYSNLPLHSTVTIFSLISTLRFDKVKFPIFMHVKPPDDVGLATLIPTVWWKFPKQVKCHKMLHKILPWSSPAVIKLFGRQKNAIISSCLISIVLSRLILYRIAVHLYRSNFCLVLRYRQNSRYMLLHTTLTRLTRSSYSLVVSWSCMSSCCKDWSTYRLKFFTGYRSWVGRGGFHWRPHLPGRRQYGTHVQCSMFLLSIEGRWSTRRGCNKHGSQWNRRGTRKKRTILQCMSSSTS